ncbi:hypothetical protein ABBQ32_002960 [Trebouxia sp. C0010 RCD-2024]
MAQVPKIPPARGNEHPETTRSGASDLAAVEVATCQQEQHRDPQAQAEVQRHMQPQHHGPRQATQNADSVHTLGVSSRSLFGEPLSQTQLDRLFSSEQRQSEQHFTDKWNFDVTDERPVPGRWTYNPASQQ